MNQTDATQRKPRRHSNLAPMAGISSSRSRQHAIAVRTVELSQPLVALTDVLDYATVRLFVLADGSPIASVDIANNYKSIGSLQLQDAIACARSEASLEPASDLRPEQPSAQTRAAFKKRQMKAVIATPDELAADVSVSIIIPTFDRPDDLRLCLDSLFKQNSLRPCEIIVVDNNPASGLTPQVVHRFPRAKLVKEARRGASYARNAGITASAGDIVVLVDDDVSAPPDWLEKLLAPYVRADVMGVTGNILPLELETDAQRLFERYGDGGLGRGFVQWSADASWFKSHRGSAVKTWWLGGTANASFRSCIFRDPDIGLMEEMLGAGMPSGSGEDLYHFYKMLKAGCTVVYEPKAFIWHRHRREMAALHRQIYNYSKGHVAYHLTTLLRDRDWRALPAVLLHLPLWQTKQFWHRLTGQSSPPITLNLVEIAGYLAAPWALWRSTQCVRLWGRSAPVAPQTIALRSSARQHVH